MGSCEERSPEVKPRAETAIVSLRRVLKEGRGEGWEVWLEQGSYILSGFICQGRVGVLKTCWEPIRGF